MRQTQQKNRMRGRGRKQPNPMSRNFESNGPDVKIRGNAAHIAEKYNTLARDAASAGDRVMAENYLQHAEHYNRIVAAATQQRAEEQQQQQANGKGNQPDMPGFDANQEASGAAAQPGGEASGDGGSGENKAGDRRPRREPRTRRRQAAAPAEAENGAVEAANGLANGEAHNDAGDDNSPNKAAASAAGISTDAAKLPGSLFGGIPEDASAGETGNDD